MWITTSEKKYKILKELGKGHSGSVLLGEDPHGHQVAIKCLSRQYNDAALKRFRREFVILRSLVHPHIAQPFDFGHDPELARYFFVAEYVEGVTLNVAIQDAGAKAALELFAQSLKALDYIHRHGVYHCDLKPANILVTSAGEVKLIDFDVASRGTLALGGTPPFLPPELAADLKSAPNPRTDIYSLGVTFYQCLTGHKPYPAKNLSELRRMLASVIPKLPTQLKPTLKPYWDGLLMGMLQKNPSQRFSTASAVLQQVLLQLGEKKNLLSVADVEYRLSQHGLPIGKEELLTRAKDLLGRGLDQVPMAEKIWVLQGETGSGMSYVLEELKILSQLQGVPVFQADQQQKNLPGAPPFSYLIDGAPKVLDPAAAEFFPEGLNRLRELLLQGENLPVWVVLAGVPKWKSLPKALRKQLKGRSTVFKLGRWGPAEARVWMGDIFQTPEIPPFLLEQILEKGEGNPKRFNQLLRQYLENGLLLDRSGNWRKDLFHPTPLFVEEFLPETSVREWQRATERISEKENSILELLAMCHQPLRMDFLEKWFGDPEILPALQQLVARRWVGPEGQDWVQILDPDFKNFLAGRLSPEEQKKRHDAILGRSELREWLSKEELHFQMARGSDPARAAEGWAFFGEDCARKGLGESAFEYFSNAFDIVPPSEIEKKFEYAVARGRSLILRNLLKDARQYFVSLLNEFADQRHRRPEIFAKIFERLGVIETKLGNREKARSYFYQGLTCMDPAYEPLEQYLGLRNFLASLDLQEGKVEAAIEEYRDTYETAQERLPFERRRVLTNNDLGAALLKAGKFDEAIRHWKELVTDLKDREDKNPLVRVFYQMGQAYQGRGEIEEARRFLEEAERHLRGLLNYEMGLRIYNSLANLFRGRDEEKALEMYEKALDAAFHTGDAYSTAVVLLNMGFLLEAQGQFPRAKQCLVQGLHYLRESGGDEKRYRAFFHSAKLSIARTSAELLQAREAAAFAMEARRLLGKDWGTPEEHFETYLALWQARALLGETGIANRTAATLKKLAKTKPQRDLLEAVQKHTAQLQIQMAKTRGKIRPPFPDMDRSRAGRTQSTHILALQSTSSELDSTP